MFQQEEERKPGKKNGSERTGKSGGAMEKAGFQVGEEPPCYLITWGLKMPVPHRTDLTPCLSVLRLTPSAV